MNTTNTKGALVALEQAKQRLNASIQWLRHGNLLDSTPLLSVADMEVIAAALQAHSPPAPAVAGEVEITEPLWDGKGNVIHAAVDRLGAKQRAAKQASETAAGVVTDALEAVDVLYDLMLQEATVGQRIDAKIALKRAILALATPPAATKVPSPAPAPKRKLIGYGECRCILTQYCDGQCRPIFGDAAPPAGSDKEPS